MDGMGEPQAPWLWVISGRDGQLIASGCQWTRLLDPPERVAEERIAAYAYRLICGGRVHELAGVVCQVQRAGSEDRPATATADIWIRRVEKLPAPTSVDRDRWPQGSRDARVGGRSPGSRPSVTPAAAGPGRSVRA